MTTQTQQTYILRFGGFYNTNWDILFDIQLEQLLEEYEIEYFDELPSDINWSEAKRLASQQIADNFNLQYFNKLQLKFDHLKSPREYNFENDEIILTSTLDINDLEKEIFNIIEDRELVRDYNDGISLYTTPRSGYAPYYTPSTLTKQHRIEIAMEVLWNQVDDDILEDISCNGGFYLPLENA